MARPRSDIGPRILHAARGRFLQQGVDGASLRQIAEDARTNIGMIYYYFPTKDNLFLAVVEEVYARLLVDLEHALAPELPVEARMSALFERFGRMTDDEFDVIRLILHEAIISSSRLARIVERFQRGHIPLVLRMLADGVVGEKFRQDLHPGSVAMATMSLVLAAQLLRRTLGDRLPAQISPPTGADLAAQLSKVLLDGVRRRPA